MKHTNLYTQKPPSILQLEVTKNCNNACIMCHKGQVSEGQDFDRTDIKELYIDQVKPIYPFLKHAMLFGDGEPMVYRGFWDIVRDIREAAPKCCIDFINNGSMMHEANIQRCLDYNVSHLGLSMGGASPETHNYIRRLSSFDEVVKNYQNLRDMKAERKTLEPYVTALIVVMQTNLKELPDFVRLARDTGWIRIEFQKLFITHSMVADEEVMDAEAEPIFEECSRIAKSAGLGFHHYPIESGLNFDTNVSNNLINHLHPLFKPKFLGDVTYKGYCKYRQPWNTVYVLHDGKVVPDCHWWTSAREVEFNECGQLDENTNILDIWNGPVYQEIRDRIQKGQILPQCRGCGLAGGVVDEFRSAETDHTNPEEEKLFVTVNIQTSQSKVTDAEDTIEQSIDDPEVKEWYRIKRNKDKDTVKKDSIYSGWEQYSDDWETNFGGQFEFLGDEWEMDSIFVSKISAIPHGGKVFEIGAGGGKVTSLLLSRNLTVVAADTSNAMLQRVKSRLPDIETYRIVSREWPELESGYFDAVVSYDTLVHVEPIDIYYYLREIERILRPGGVAFLHVSNVLSELGFNQWLLSSPSLGRRDCGAFSTNCAMLMSMMLSRYSFTIESIDHIVGLRDLLYIVRKND